MKNLTRREKEVLNCLADGLTTNEAADRLSVSPETVKSHRRTLMQKLDARNAFHMAILAIRHELIPANNNYRVA